MFVKQVVGLCVDINHDGECSMFIFVHKQGASFTRFQTLRLQKIFPESLANQLISYGSCQFPTLGFVVERFKAIQAFIPETFYKIKVLHEVEEDCVEFSWKRNRLFHHTACLVLYQICMEVCSSFLEHVV
ncbi:DNA topoisomerase 3-alpha [Xenoophorus captivus]|uniref:DNA topoisomerase n=1 Tax=Xenoophorus captivus TaxID=1517983 RepID=A0ABV0REV0_9TELE